MSTATPSPKPMTAPSDTTTTNTLKSAQTSAAPSTTVRDLMIGGLHLPTNAGGLYDKADEEEFVRAQANAFAEISDAALARAIQESEITAAQKAAEDTRRSRSSATSSSTAPRPSPARAPAPAYRGSPSESYALVSPSTLGVRPGTSRRTAEPVAPHQAVSAPAALVARAAGPPPSPSQWRATSTPAPRLLSSKSCSPPSRAGSATPGPTSTHGSWTADRQQQYYAQQRYQQYQQYQQYQRTNASKNQPSASTTSPKLTSTAPQPHYRRQAAPTPAPFTVNSNSTSYSSNIASKPSTSEAPSTSSSRPSASKTPIASNLSDPHATWHPKIKPSTPACPTPTPTPTTSSSPSSIPIPPPVSRSRSLTTSSTLSTTPTSISAQDLRNGVLASMAPQSDHSTSSPSDILGRTRTPTRIKLKTRPIGRRILSPDHDARLVEANNFLGIHEGRKCADCGHHIEGPNGSVTIPSEPFSQNLLKHLHDICSSDECGASYCRGCFSLAKGRCKPAPPSSSAPPSRAASPVPSRSSSRRPSHASEALITGCTGSRGCNVKSCCPFAAVIAISCILDAFDAECIRVATRTCGLESPALSPRAAQAFVRILIARSNAPNTRAFETMTMRALHSLSSWLAVFQARRNEANAREVEDDAEASEDGGERKESVDSLKAKGLLQVLVSNSLILPFVHGFLQNLDVGDWLKHSEIYVLILEVLRRLVENGLSTVLDDPIDPNREDDDELVEDFGETTYAWKSQNGRPRGILSASESSASSDADDYSSESDGDATETDATSPGASDSEDDEDDNGKKARRVRGCSRAKFALRSAVRGRRKSDTGIAIKALVTKLEEHRGPLMNFGATVRYAAVKAKVDALCVGISYLLLQQILDWD